ncbi:hypothetical protein SAY86_002429 [Trapa natans]|uniref:HMA domain-containing protein n=1 Tax=Trapa natans TaxID=22666 RepID=A0AAN7LQZ2_TRANT|nr:hypothetical protein SAY86_002429 [Trapa natans]
MQFNLQTSTPTVHEGEVPDDQLSGAHSEITYNKRLIFPIRFTNELVCHHLPSPLFQCKAPLSCSFHPQQGFSGQVLQRRKEASSKRWVCTVCHLTQGRLTLQLVLLLLPATIICLLLFLLSKGKSIASSGLDCMNDRKQSMEVVISSKDMPVQNGALCTLASLESLSMPPEVVLSADIGCVQCRKRIADVISRMNEVETITVSVREKMVTLSCRYSYPAKATPPKQQLPAIHRKPFSKIAIIKKILRGR